MKFWDEIGWRIGALPVRRVIWTLVLIFSVWVILDVLVFKFSSGLTRSSYDAMVRKRVFVAAVDPRIVIIDIDEASLARMGKEFGRWPWSRDTLATVLEHVERQQPAAVVWDILFSDLDRLSPGGDAAFNQAVGRSGHSHFSVVRLPQANDAASQLTRAALPGLWAGHSLASDTPVSDTHAPTVALIAPALPAVAASRLGFNNGYVDSDGVLRRYRYKEVLQDGSVIQSLPMSVASAVNATAYGDLLNRRRSALEPRDELIAWRERPNAYRHVSFADVFAQAEGARADAEVPGFSGKVVIIGSTAPSLHDIHPTPLSPIQAGVDSLATAIDNALNQRYLAELPRWLQAGLAVALCIGLALWVQFKSAASLEPALFPMPLALMTISYVSLNGSPVFLDLHLAAGLALVFLAVLRYWSAMRRNYWCSPPPRTRQPLAIWSWWRADAWLEDSLDRLIDTVERYAPACRVVVCGTSASTLRWPELARFATLVGPQDALHDARKQLQTHLRRIAQQRGEPVQLDSYSNREQLASIVLANWVKLERIDQVND